MFYLMKDTMFHNKKSRPTCCIFKQYNLNSCNRSRKKDSFIVLSTGWIKNIYVYQTFMFFITIIMSISCCIT